MAKRFIWLNETKNLSMSLQLDILLVHVLMITNPSEKKWKNVCILYLVKSYNLLLKPHLKKYKCVSINNFS